MSLLRVRDLGCQQYLPVWEKMQAFTEQRDNTTEDEIWLLEHEPVFTQGMNGKPEHILNKTEIPVVEIDRGGQVTYHGPGQLIAYCLFDLKRKKFGIRQMVTALEDAVIDLLSDESIKAVARKDAPGVYVEGAKIAALGLRVKRGCSYHGLSLNVDMDLTPFKDINPCGYENLDVTQLKNLGIKTTLSAAKEKLLVKICQQFSIDQITRLNGF
ncbi:MAG: lipoyl(octanoyl) transferase LipB [Gammaproteobacteria bacterium]|nr:lipoyl(octanoyl) transferase LipB [Gammaproteobacteria bacterium]